METSRSDPDIFSRVSGLALQFDSRSLVDEEEESDAGGRPSSSDSLVVRRVLARRMWTFNKI